jgi:phenylacetate-CoA ligase
VVYLLGYSSTLYWLALEAIRAGGAPQMKVVVTNAEPLFDYQRDAIARAFRCPVVQTYGQAELGSAMSECVHQRLHIWPEVGYIELLDPQGQPVAPGQPGRLISTSLLNDSMPLVRYDVLDWAQLPAAAEPCPCGRGLPPAGKVLGREKTADKDEKAA